jgi:hypothetical protein
LTVNLQGATKERVLLDVTKHPSPPYMTFEMLLVALSRCRHAKDFRLFGSGFERFATLKADICTVAWLAGFGDLSRSLKWNAQLAKDKLVELRAADKKK